MFFLRLSSTYSILCSFNLKYPYLFQKLKECFESKDIAMLQKCILEFPKEEAEYHMKRCVESGLWVPNAADAAGGEGEGEGEEEVYDEVEGEK